VTSGRIAKPRRRRLRPNVGGAADAWRTGGGGGVSEENRYGGNPEEDQAAPGNGQRAVIKPSPRRRNNIFGEKKVCRFCVEKIDDINYKDVRLLSSFVAERGKIVPRRISGVCAPHQRRLNDAIKKRATSRCCRSRHRFRVEQALLPVRFWS